MVPVVAPVAADTQPHPVAPVAVDTHPHPKVEAPVEDAPQPKRTFAPEPGKQVSAFSRHQVIAVD